MSLHYQRFVEAVMAQLKPGVEIGQAIKAAAPVDADILEIGPGARALFTKREFPKLKISDYCSTEELRQSLVTAHGVEDIPPDMVETVDYVCADGDLLAHVPQGQAFDLIFSSHNIEHQPNLILHLQSVAQLLRPDGVAAFVVPDKRCTFDVFRQLTSTSDLLLAFAERRQIPSAKQLFDSTFQSAQMPTSPIREIGRDDALALGDIQDALARFQARLSGADTAFADLHHSVFTPQSFQILVMELYLLQLCSLLPVLVTGSIGNSFVSMLVTVPPPQDAVALQALHEEVKARLLKSYKRMSFERG